MEQTQETLNKGHGTLNKGHGTPFTVNGHRTQDSRTRDTGQWQRNDMGHGTRADTRDIGHGTVKGHGTPDTGEQNTGHETRDSDKGMTWDIGQGTAGGRHGTTGTGTEQKTRDTEQIQNMGQTRDS